MSETIDYAKLAAEIAAAPENEIDAELATWPEHIVKLVSARGSVSTEERAAQVRTYRPRVEAVREHEQRQKEKQEKAAAHDASYQRDRAKINRWKEDYKAWETAYRNGDKSQPRPERPTGLELYWPGDEFEKVDGRKAPAEAPRSAPGALYRTF